MSDRTVYRYEVNAILSFEVFSSSFDEADFLVANHYQSRELFSPHFLADLPAAWLKPQIQIAPQEIALAQIVATREPMIMRWVPVTASKRARRRA